MTHRMWSCLLWCALLIVIAVRGEDTVLSSLGLQSPELDEAIKKREGSNRPNILLILADDLGFGDTSVHPFVGNGALTPNLEAMAARGTIMTNFHTAATVCTPTRASILTGMNPWRLGVRSVFEYGLAHSDRNAWLPQVPTVASVFRENDYIAKHSGKWHVGGMRNDDLDMRQLDPGSTSTPGHKRCPHPGPNQQGFDEYVSVLDGPGAPRQNELQVGKKLYSQGCRHLLRNDKDIGKESGENRESLSQCEARHAIRQMTDSVKQGKPFYQQLWFHAPHAPWEMLNTPEVTQLYAERNDKSKMDVNKLPNCNGKDKSIRYCSMTGQGGGRKLVDRGPQMQDKYQSMITDMDTALGKVLRALKELNVERDTLVVFTSDNGPEEEAGCTALWKLKSGHPWAGWDNWKNLYTTVGLRGNKRFVYQGGLHVPTVVQWVGTVPKGRNCSTFAVSTDLFPTFLDAAGLPVPKNVRLDGMSFLSEIVPERNAPLSAATSAEADVASSSANRDGQAEKEGWVGVISLTNVTSPVVMSPKGGEMHRARRLHKKQLHERITFWHNDFEGPRATAARLFDFKLILDGEEQPFEMFDLRSDPREARNLLTKGSARLIARQNNQHKQPSSVGAAAASQPPAVVSNPKPGLFTTRNILANKEGVRSDPELHKWLFARVYAAMRDYADYGNAAHVIYKSRNPGREYNATVESDVRYISGNLYKGTTKEKAATLRQNTIYKGVCSTPCSCDVPRAADVAAYPIDDVDLRLQYIMPRHPYGFVDATAMLAK